MKKFLHRPVVVEAFQLIEGNAINGDSRLLYRKDGTVLIATLEGVMTAYPGDYIIKGTKGEMYCCKEKIFNELYEPLEDEVTETFNCPICGVGKPHSHTKDEIYNYRKKCINENF